MHEAVALGDPEAMLILGVYYDTESVLLGAKREVEKAKNLYQMAANLGHEGANYNLKVLAAEESRASG